MNPRPDDVSVPLGARSYTVRVVSDDPAGLGPFARESLDRSWAGRGCRRALVVTDANVADRAEAVVEALGSAGIVAIVAVVEPGEATKSLDAAAGLLSRLVAIRADRHVAVVALGGGVVGDLAGFVAATYARGVPLLMVPTTLLAAVDSAVGGKVGVNLPGAKNIVGAFHQPSGVWVDTAALGTLPPREVRCGLAEVVKYGLILDADLFAEVEGTADALLAGDPAATRSVIAHCCRLKAAVVAEDEREETGARALLNFGHTVGHAIEAVAGYGGAFRHGEAVAAGMVIESILAERLGLVGPDLTPRLVALLARLGLPTTAPGLDVDDLLDAMARDKKNAGGRVRFVLPTRLGSAALTDAATEADVRAALVRSRAGA